MNSEFIEHVGQYYIADFFSFQERSTNANKPYTNKLFFNYVWEATE
jgi:hypothetical protein